MRRKAKSLLVNLLVLASLVFSCRPQGSDPTGGETHFLTRCEASHDSCGEQLTCVCGVCTLPCAERATCGGLPAAECVLSSAEDGCLAADPAKPGVCEVSCVVDADCSVISPVHRCERGTCRAGTLASSGAGGSAASPEGGASDGGSSDGGSSDGGASVCERGNVPANQVLVIGDSFFATTHQITAYLEGLARDAGSVSTGERYRDRSSLLSNTLALAGNGITDQYTSGASESAVKVVIMDGGGADALLGSCDTADASCSVIASAAAAAQDLLSKMATDNVSQVIYAFYPDAGEDDVRARVDALRPLVQSACEHAPLPCHWLDLRPVFAGHYAEYVQADQLNPTDAGSRASAGAIWALMQQYCVAQ